MGLGKRTRPATYVSKETEASELGQGLQVSAALGQALWVRRAQSPVFKSLPFSWA